MKKSYIELLEEVTFSTARSGGPGGQNVNKVESKVILTFCIGESEFLKSSEKATLRKKLSSKITKEDKIIIYNQETRSQLENKKRVQKVFLKMVEKALFKPKLRRATKPKRSAIESRLKSKKIRSEVKENRKKID